MPIMLVVNHHPLSHLLHLNKGLAAHRRYDQVMCPVPFCYASVMEGNDNFPEYSNRHKLLINT